MYEMGNAKISDFVVITSKCYTSPPLPFTTVTDASNTFGATLARCTFVICCVNVVGSTRSCLCL